MRTGLSNRDMLEVLERHVTFGIETQRRREMKFQADDRRQSRDEGQTKTDNREM
jgi:hypothetical protein